MSCRKDLGRYTSFKIGGPAKIFTEPKNISGLKAALCQAQRRGLRFLVLGAGTNVLISSVGLDASVARLSAPFFKKINLKGGRISAGAGTGLAVLIREAFERGLSGLEFLAGIPGTLGGALAMNAGSQGNCIGSITETVTVMDYNGRIRLFTKPSLKFGYRKSNLSKYIILDASLALKSSGKPEIENRIKKYLEYKKNTQDLSFPSAGCVFKNPGSVSAGKLIDSCGLKALRIGDACISAKHANFIINLGKAGSDDVLGLIRLVKREVKKKFNITLKPEIKIWR